jgi:acyl dehydratase
MAEEAPVLTHKLTRGDLIEYAGASGDFNPMHTDEMAAQEAGLKSVFGHGMLSAGLLTTAIENWLGVGAITRFKVRFVKQTWPGEVLSTQITVRDRHDGLIELDCQLINEDGEVKVEGEATARAAPP